MNDFDQFMKHQLKAKHYIRYADDMVILSEDKDWLRQVLPRIETYLRHHLHLALHSDKTFLQTIASRRLSRLGALSRSSGVTQ